MPSLLRSLAGLVLLIPVEQRLLRELGAASLPSNARVAQGILTGHAYWRAFQNRLLGPYLVEGFAKLIGASFQDAYSVLTQDLAALATVLVFFFLGRKLGSYPKALVGTCVFVGLFIVLQDSGWFYIWDFLDLVIMVLFFQAILMNAPLVVFVILFLVELLNREQAAFIALWLVLSSRRGPRAILGVALLAFGVGWTAYIRQRLFISSIEPSIGADLYHQGFGVHLPLMENFSKLIQFWNDGTIVALGMTWLTVIVLRRIAREQALLGAAMLGGIMLFGVVDEPRVFTSLVPFVVLFGAETYRRQVQPADALAPAQA